MHHRYQCSGMGAGGCTSLYDSSLSSNNMPAHFLPPTPAHSVSAGRPFVNASVSQARTAEAEAELAAVRDAAAAAAVEAAEAHAAAAGAEARAAAAEAAAAEARAAAGSQVARPEFADVKLPACSSMHHPCSGCEP